MADLVPSPDVPLVVATLLVAAACALCLRWIVRNGRPTPLGKAGTRWQHHRGLMWLEIVLLTGLLVGALAAVVWLAVRAP